MGVGWLMGRWGRWDGVDGYIIEDALIGLRSSYISSVVERRSFLAFQRIIFVLANGLWYSRAAHGLIAAAPE